MSYKKYFFLFAMCRVSKERALAGIRDMPPDTSSVLLQPPESDKPWTPGQWRKTTEFSDESSEELCTQALLPDQVFTTYNAALEKIASISNRKVEPLTFRLKIEWDKATQSEQRLCVEKVDEAKLIQL